MNNVRFAAVAAFVTILTSCGIAPASVKPSPKATTDSTKTIAAQTEKKSDSASFDWRYYDKVDKMTSKQIYFATIDATEELELKFPYNGGSIPSIMVRRKNGETNVIFGVTKGQFMPGIEGQTIKARFDDSPAEAYHCAGSDDEDSRYLFIDQATRFVKRMKTSKKTLIEVEMYDNGMQVVEFNTAGFVADNFLSHEATANRKKTKSEEDFVEDPKHPLERVEAGAH